jgi:hypothetical protein
MAGVQGKQLADAPLGVTTGKINDDAVTTVKILALAVTTAKIAPAAVTKAETDASIFSSDGTRPLTGAASAGGFKWTSVGTPTAATDAATKGYVDGIATGLAIKYPARVLAASNQALTGTPTIDGVATAVGNRVLLTAQTTGSQNGFWVVAAGAWSRPTDFAAGSSAASAFSFIQEGTTYADQGWVCTNNVGSDVVDTDSLTFVQFSTAVSVTFAAPVNVGAANASGSASTVNRSDHVHATPLRRTENKLMTASVTTANDQAATATTVTNANALGQYISLRVNGISYHVGDGVKTTEAFISNDGGTTARTFAAVAAGDSIRWRGSGSGGAGFELSASDVLDLEYNAFT